MSTTKFRTPTSQTAPSEPEHMPTLLPHEPEPHVICRTETPIFRGMVREDDWMRALVVGGYRFEPALSPTSVLLGREQLPPAASRVMGTALVVRRTKKAVR